MRQYIKRSFAIRGTRTQAFRADLETGVKTPLPSSGQVLYRPVGIPIKDAEKFGAPLSVPIGNHTARVQRTVRV